MTLGAISPATGEQIKALQTLYGQWKSHTLQEGGDPRSARLAWASENTGRNVSSFSDLSREEARILIDILKGSMGQPLGTQPQPWRRINSRERAQEAGTAGRKGERSSLVQMVSPDDLARVNELVNRLEWTRDQFEAWLKSPRSPLGATNQAVIRTAAQANRIYWALKAMLVRAGRWRGVSRKKSSYHMPQIAGKNGADECRVHSPAPTQRANRHANALS
jgi:hypothetical protein